MDKEFRLGPDSITVPDIPDIVACSILLWNQNSEIV